MTNIFRYIIINVRIGIRRRTVTKSAVLSYDDRPPIKRTGLNYGRKAVITAMFFKTIKELIIKYKELILYCIFGFLTFCVDTGSFAVMDLLLDLDNNPVLLQVCNIGATVLAIIFAYITNRMFVFENTATTTKGVIREMISFFSARALTLILAIVLMWLGATVMGIDQVIVKLVSNVIVIILNYVFSKLWIFNTKPKDTDK